MRGVTYDQFDMNTLVHDKVRTMWNRLSEKAEENHTSLGKVASDCGLSGSAVYQSIRRVNEKGNNYIDCLVYCVDSIARALGTNLDYILQGDNETPSQSVSDALFDLLDNVSFEQLEKFRINMIGRLQV